MSLTDVMSAAGLSSWTEVALIVCLITFAAIVFWVFVMRGKPSYEHIRNLPLDEDGVSSPHAATKGGDL